MEKFHRSLLFMAQFEPCLHHAAVVPAFDMPHRLERIVFVSHGDGDGPGPVREGLRTSGLGETQRHGTVGMYSLQSRVPYDLALILLVLEHLSKDEISGKRYLKCCQVRLPSLKG